MPLHITGVAVQLNCLSDIAHVVRVGSLVDSSIGTPSQPVDLVLQLLRQRPQLAWAERLYILTQRTSHHQRHFSALISLLSTKFFLLFLFF